MNDKMIILQFQPALMKQLVGALIALSLLLLPFPSFSQGKRIDGNGKVSTSIRTVNQFHAIQVGTYCNVEITCGQMAKLEITTDDNLLPYLKTPVRDGILYIETEGWIEATQIHLKIGVPFLHSLNNSGWGKIEVNNLDTRTFDLRAEVGEIVLRGKTETLNITAGTGEIDAFGMDAKTVLVKQRSHAMTKVSAGEMLRVQLEGGEVIYKGNPLAIEKTLSEGATLSSLEEASTNSVPDLVYVRTILKNNSAQIARLQIKGPKGKRFSYGFNIGPFGSRSENVPAGTRILNNNGETLVTISEKDAGKRLKLFK